VQDVAHWREKAGMAKLLVVSNKSVSSKRLITHMDLWSASELPPRDESESWMASGLAPKMGLILAAVVVALPDVESHLNVI